MDEEFGDVLALIGGATEVEKEINEEIKDETPNEVPETKETPQEVSKPAEVQQASREEEPVVPSVEDELRAEIARLSGLLTAGNITQGTEQVYPPSVEQKQEVAQQAQQQTQQANINHLEALKGLLSGDLLTQDELDVVIDKPELLNAAYKKKNEQLVQHLFGALPNIVESYVQKEIQVNKLVTTFYEMYDDLRPYADFVKLNMGEIEKANPTMTYKDIFEKTATQCRKRLGLKEQPSGNEGRKSTGGKVPAAFAGSKSNMSKASMVEKKPLFDENAADLLNFR